MNAGHDLSIIALVSSRHIAISLSYFFLSIAAVLSGASLRVSVCVCVCVYAFAWVMRNYSL